MPDTSERIANDPATLTTERCPACGRSGFSRDLQGRHTVCSWIDCLYVEDLPQAVADQPAEPSGPSGRESPAAWAVFDENGNETMEDVEGNATDMLLFPREELANACMEIAAVKKWSYRKAALYEHPTPTDAAELERLREDAIDRDKAWQEKLSEIVGNARKQVVALTARAESAEQWHDTGHCPIHNRPWAKLPSFHASHCPECLVVERDAANAERTQLADRVKVLEGALQPFANFSCSPPGECQCHNCIARDALAAKGAENGQA